jgi:Fe-S-cluster containining protein
MYLGDYLVIDRQTGPFTFACSMVSTGMQFAAEIDEDKRRLFLDPTFPDLHPHVCRFLRPDGDLIRCTIHRDSPDPCKSYRCIVMRIFDRSGVMVGIVTGTLALHSDDAALRAVWEDALRKIPETLPDAEGRLQKYLEENGWYIE